MKAHLVDGTFELFRAYFGAPSAQSPDGREVGATRAFLRTLVSLLSEAEVSHVGVAFDTVVESFRNEMFDGYKTGEGIEPDLFSQFPLVERATEALGVVAWRMIEFEADDGLAAAAAKYSADVEQTCILSPDKDLYQCVEGTRIVTVDRMRKKLFDEAAVVAKLGVPPTSVPDYLALVGDSADGIPGVPRWGAKSTATVLAHYKNFESIPDDPEKWAVTVRGAKSLATELASRREDAALYKKLATLRTDVPLSEELSDIEWRGARREELTAFCAEIGENSALERVSRWQ